MGDDALVSISVLGENREFTVEELTSGLLEKASEIWFVPDGRGMFSRVLKPAQLSKKEVKEPIKELSKILNFVPFSEISHISYEFPARRGYTALYIMPNPPYREQAKCDLPDFAGRTLDHIGSLDYVLSGRLWYESNKGVLPPKNFFKSAEAFLKVITGNSNVENFAYVMEDNRLKGRKELNYEGLKKMLKLAVGKPYRP
jgi:hypothetical protein